MNIVRWIIGRCTNRGKALFYYRRGMFKAKKHNHQGAIEDYARVISDQEAPNDVKAMAHYNRALVLLAINDSRKCTADLKAVLAMSDTPVNIRTMARQKLEKLESRAAKHK